MGRLVGCIERSSHGYYIVCVWDWHGAYMLVFGFDSGSIGFVSLTAVDC